MTSPQRKPRLLDLFCGAGGAAVGYARAGFEVVGVDLVAQPNYPFEFVCDDALTVLDRMLNGDDWDWGSITSFDAIHGSPPCQAFTHARLIGHRGRRDHPRLIKPTRVLLQRAGVPYVIENVEGARGELIDPVMLCGSTFGLNIQRHRLFECNFPVMAAACQHGNFGNRRFPGTPRYDGTRPLSKVVNPMASGCGHEDFAEAMSIDWMPKRGLRPTKELCEAIPPAYTEHVGYYLMLELGARGVRSRVFRG